MTKHRLPDFIMIGASKSSTTTMYRLLQQHPSVYLPREKGAYYFNDPNFDRPDAFDRYVALFQSAAVKTKVIGESSNTYTHQPNGGPIAKRIKSCLGSVKLLYMVRDPVARGISHYRHKCLDPEYRRPFGEALDRDPLLATVGCYAYQLQPYLAEFGADRIKVIAADRLHREPANVLQEVEVFLGLEPHVRSPGQTPRSNRFEELQRTARLQKLLGRELSSRLRHLTPAPLRRLVKRLTPPEPDPPPVTQADRELLYDRIRHDLLAFQDIAGAQIDAWPSMQKLRAGKV